MEVHRKVVFMVVKNKWTYALLALIPLGAIKIMLMDVQATGIDVQGIFISIMMGVIGLYLFMRFNTQHYIFNPNHPKNK